MMQIGTTRDPKQPNICGSRSDALSRYSLMCPGCFRIARERGYPAASWWNRRTERPGERR